jgi:hypothetical protein
MLLGGITRHFMTHAQIHECFTAEFHAGSKAVVVTSAEIDEQERELSTLLPQSYRSFLLTYGCLCTPSLLSLIVDKEADLWAIAGFIEPAQAVTDTRLYWSGGMDKNLIGFAGDVMGNLFCFRRIAVGAPRPDDAPICFFGHEFCDQDIKLADSFDDWLFSYLKLTREDLTR